MSSSIRVDRIANVVILIAAGYLSIANASRTAMRAQLDRKGSTVVRNTTRGPCGNGFDRPDSKWARYGVFQYMNDEDFAAVLFGKTSHKDFEPTKRENCMQSANLGVHAFLASNLAEALKKAPANTAVVDIGSGTGFLLSVFHQYVNKDVEVIGVELDNGAAEHSRRVLPDVKVFEEDAFQFQYEKAFSVMNVGFASESLPEHLIGMMADGGTMIAPLCTKALDGALDLKTAPMGQNCASKFHKFEVTRASTGKMSATDVGVIGPLMRFFYVPSSSHPAADPKEATEEDAGATKEPMPMKRKAEQETSSLSQQNGFSMPPIITNYFKEGYSGKRVKHASGVVSAGSGAPPGSMWAIWGAAPAQSAGVRSIASAAILALLCVKAQF